MSVLENMFKSYFHQEDFYKLYSRPRQHQPLNQADSASLSPWIDWVVDYCHFFLANILRCRVPISHPSNSPSRLAPPPLFGLSAIISRLWLSTCARLLSPLKP